MMRSVTFGEPGSMPARVAALPGPWYRPLSAHFIIIPHFFKDLIKNQKGTPFVVHVHGIEVESGRGMLML
jgi:hypothetical protein